MANGTEPAEPERPVADETIVLPRIPSESARTTRPVGRDRDEAMQRVRAAGMSWARDVARAMDEVRPTEATEVPAGPAHRRRRGRPVLLIVLCAVVAVLALGGGTVWALRGQRSAPRNPAAVVTGQPSDSPSPVPPSDGATPSAEPSASASVGAGATRTAGTVAKTPTKAAATHGAGNGAAGGATTPPATPSPSPDPSAP